ncbi:Uncharacterised protein [Sphingobacterium mizutaii]|uniref:Uncharacterized protein n=1 Tax=Sphingobacterium mizutaii TaxID=1010 RepID=A0AAJ4X9B8_9SPHI|nr:hypothetical protein SAMN05192578_1156 [Sphingobacterium mizutaii]SNV42183.1 Uncharacterised protein [Sphingobacterium mizutaii]
MTTSRVREPYRFFTIRSELECTKRDSEQSEESISIFLRGFCHREHSERTIFLKVFQKNISPSLWVIRLKIRLSTNISPPLGVLSLNRPSIYYPFKIYNKSYQINSIQVGARKFLCLLSFFHCLMFILSYGK